MDTLESNNSPSNQSPPSPVELEKDKEKPGKKEHPIAEAIDVFLHRSQDIRSATIFVAIAQKMRKDRFEKLLRDRLKNRK